MRRHLARARRAGTWLLVGWLVIAACETTDHGAPGKAGEADKAEIYAAAATYLATEANGFGPGHRFTELLVVERTAAGNNNGRQIAAAELNERERTAIGASLSTLSPVRFVASRTAWLDAEYSPVVRGAAILTLAPILWDEDGSAAVGASLWCGASCAVWTIINVEFDGEDWRAVGDTARTIS